VKISPGIILGLTAAFGWGVSDFIARFASRRVGAYRALFFMQVIGFLAVSVFVISSGGLSHGTAPGWHPWALAAAAGILSTIGSLALYYSFEVGVLTVVAPISSSYPAITVALAFLSGERIRTLNAAGLAIAIIGIILAATSFSADSKSTVQSPQTDPHLSKGVGWSLVSMISFGIMFWFLGFHVLPILGAAPSVWVIRLSVSSMLLLAAAPSHQNLALPRGSVCWLLVAMGLLDTTAYVANTAGLHAGPVSVITVIASLYGAVTVLLSSIFLRERLERTQWLGIALIFAGIVLVSV
jgi:drug/metabolite transporter (DMT)-like permease